MTPMGSLLEAVDIGVTFSDFAATLRGDRTGLKVRLAGTPMKFAFDGTMSVRPTLKVEGAPDSFHFSGEADLGYLAGGVYHYDGHADGTNFFSNYSSKYDHGTFQMTRP